MPIDLRAVLLRIRLDHDDLFLLDTSSADFVFAIAQIVMRYEITEKIMCGGEEISPPTLD